MIFIHATGVRNPKLGREHIDTEGFFYCDFCRCYTNANYRGCCDEGRTADRSTNTEGHSK